jgi:hypothetical protein
VQGPNHLQAAGPFWLWAGRAFSLVIAPIWLPDLLVESDLPRFRGKRNKNSNDMKSDMKRSTSYRQNKKSSFSFFI